MQTKPTSLPSNTKILFNSVHGTHHPQGVQAASWQRHGSELGSSASGRIVSENGQNPTNLPFATGFDANHVWSLNLEGRRQSGRKLLSLQLRVLDPSSLPALSHCWLFELSIQPRDSGHQLVVPLLALLLWKRPCRQSIWHNVNVTPVASCSQVKKKFPKVRQRCIQVLVFGQCRRQSCGQLFWNRCFWGVFGFRLENLSSGCCNFRVTSHSRLGLLLVTVLAFHLVDKVSTGSDPLKDLISRRLMPIQALTCAACIQQSKGKFKSSKTWNHHDSRVAKSPNWRILWYLLVSCVHICWEKMNTTEVYWGPATTDTGWMCLNVIIFSFIHRWLKWFFMKFR